MASADKVAPKIYGGHGMAGLGAVDPLDGFSHLVFEVADLDRSEHFYREVIGLDPMGRGLLAEEAPHSVFRLNTGQLLVLLEVERPEPRRKNTSSIHHAFLLTPEQYAEAKERFTAAGYEISDTREQFRARGEFSMDIFDPDDHRWQVQTYTDDAHETIRSGAGTVRCGPVSKFAVGSVTTFAEGNFFLTRDARGFLALSRWCRHMNGKLSYQQEHWRFWCAFHGACYDLEGTHIGHLPDIPPLRYHPVTIDEDGVVWVNTDTFLERETGETPPRIAASEPVAAPAD
jgi:catechol 2,3-dioxygenase-like lactoylglutathione lyase family enzyme